MISLSKKLMLALDAVLYIACHSSSEPISSKEISEKLGVQQRYLEQILQRFVHEGILRGVRGPKGGYTLAREKRRITLGLICSAYFKGEEPEENGQQDGTALGQKLIFPLIDQLKQNFVRELDSITVENLCEKAEKSGLLKKQPEKVDFAI